ncbi:universal stress protein [Palleronia sediminis]|uniref:Universal stress protein n=1 Tax=Palleronia sediminis TaxID=2547833 RepID=A0A4R6AKD4_9RHOB|nr:universal stress protein [Palleronia sediminis]TDL81933.1 universal stress protein [Palleronia sediminis]
MFTHIMAPVDMTALPTLKRALDAAADMARHHGARVTYVSATNNTPGRVARTPEEFGAKLAAFAEEQGKTHGIETASHALVLHDARHDLDRALVRAASDLKADLVVMASHEPKFSDYFWSSNGGAVAEHARASVLIVRGGPTPA